MPLVKLTIYPEPRDIPEDELPTLRAQGLIEEGDPAAADPAGPAGQPTDDEAGEAGDDPEETQ